MIPGMDRPPTDDRALDAPFPLKQRFLTRFVPGFLALIAVSLVIIALTAQQAVEAIYLELAERRAETIARSVADSAPAAWDGLMAGQPVAEAGGGALAAAFAREERQQRLPELKIYDTGRHVLYATHAEEIGTMEDGAALRRVIAEGEAGIVPKTLPDGTEQYELYVPFFDASGALRAVFELYEPVGYLDSILLGAALPIVAIPGALFALLGLTLYRLVRSAQGDIDARTAAIVGLRRRIESLVSRSAVEAARRSGADGPLASRRVRTVLFFSDIRDFTGFSERTEPEAVVAFLDRVMALQVGLIRKHGGDVDKMIGDAVLARFDGPDGGGRALAAARAIQAAWRKGDHPRALGIGIYEGEVILGTIGPEDRRDFTVIGDSVNAAARLCSAAKAGEIVVAARLADEGFGPEETLKVKGRAAPIAVRRARPV